MGFTLIETLVAMTIFAIGAVAMFVVFPASSMALRQAKEYTDIGLLLDSHLSLVKAIPFDQLANSSVTENLPAYVQKIDRVVSQDAALPDLKHVKIITSYISKGRIRTDSVTTYVVKT
ncbi:MAG: prepilin-type N-terminal cleavage/methylation domain-containing protein [Candidatus Omnitrophica bacterium]|nr:prepilin-type N-terminal cleavage/methylation domain-containing protein [Candidatus Omnitrophota bacterium]